MKIDGVQYSWKISNNLKDWTIFWEDEEGFQELILMKDGIINNLEGKAFYLGLCFWGALGGINDPMEGYDSPLDYAIAKFGEENAEIFTMFYKIGYKFGQWIASRYPDLYRIYCPAPFNDTAWKNMVNKMAVELIFSYPWNPFPMKNAIRWAWTEIILNQIKQLLYPDDG